jgi:hypothetical protein
MYHQPIELVILAFPLMKIAVSVVMLVLIILQRHSRILRAISVEFCGLTVVGCIVCTSAVIGFPLENNTASCYSQPWVITIGGSLVLSPLLTKEWRIDRIFNTANIVRVNISNLRLLAETVVMLTPQILISIFWMAFEPPQTRIAIPDPVRPALNYTECVFPSAVFPALAFSYVVFQLLIVAILAFRIRHVADDFNQARSLGIGAYLLLF